MQAACHHGVVVYCAFVDHETGLVMAETVLVTGSTGFIGRALTQRLSESGYAVRVLLRPSKETPRLPRNVDVEAVVAGLDDPRGLTAAMQGVKAVYHLAGAETGGVYASLLDTDIRGTQAIASAAAQSGVERLLYVSHLGVDRSSAYPLMRSKAIAEENIRRSGAPYTILRSAIVFGPGDSFTTGIGVLAQISRLFFLLPGGGKTLLQPLWIDDLVTCLVWGMEDDSLVNQSIEIGGAEYLTFRQIAEMVLGVMNKPRWMLSTHPALLRGLTVVIESIYQRAPINQFWLDYLAAARTCALDTLPRTFHLMPTRFTQQQLSYLRQVDWQALARASLRLRQRT